MFRIGEKVQAVDELGRWESARVVAVGSDGPVTVHFPGWDSSHDVQPGDDQIRRPVDYASYSDAQCNQRRNQQKVSRCQLGLLRNLCDGDLVEVVMPNGVEKAEVIEVDQFKHSLKVCLEGKTTEVSLELIHMEEANDTEPKPKNKAKRHRSCRQPSSATPGSSSSTQDQQTPVESVSAELPPKEIQGFFEVTTSNGSVTCGTVCQVQPQGFLVVVREINHTKDCFSAVCWILDSETHSVDQDLEIRLPVRRLRSIGKVALGRTERKLFDKLARAQFQKYVKLLKEDFAFRKLVRTNNVMKSLRKEIQSAFTSSSLRRTFSLGMLSVDIDLNLFSLDWFGRKRSLYSYRDGTIGNLDFLMGDKWDIYCRGDQTKFVTQLVIWLRDGNLHGTVYIAFFPRGTVSDDYRVVLDDYIKETRLPLPEDEATIE